MTNTPSQGGSSGLSADRLEAIVREVVKATAQSQPAHTQLAHAQTTQSARPGCTHRRFDLDLVNTLAAKARAKAEELGAQVTFAAVDNGGNLVALHRMDDAMLVSLQFAQDKAYTAAFFQAPTSSLTQRSQPGGDFYSLTTNHGGHIVVIGGGVPIFFDGVCVGAVGISGGEVEEDIAIANHVRDYAEGNR